MSRCCELGSFDAVCGQHSAVGFGAVLHGVNAEGLTSEGEKQAVVADAQTALAQEIDLELLERNLARNPLRVSANCKYLASSFGFSVVHSITKRRFRLWRSSTMAAASARASFTPKPYHTAEMPKGFMSRITPASKSSCPLLPFCSAVPARKDVRYLWSWVKKNVDRQPRRCSFIPAANLDGVHHLIGRVD